MSDLHGTLLALEERTLATRHGPFRAHLLRNLETRAFTVALVRGDPTGPEPLLARVHSSCITSESWRGCDCDCAVQLDEALRRLAAEGRGILVHLQQEGRGAGFAAKARDRMQVQASRHRLTTFEAYERMGLGGERRRYDDVAFVARRLGVRAPLRLLTNNPAKRTALEACKLVVDDVVPLEAGTSPFNLHYLASKSRSGHALAAPGRGEAPAELPEEVESFEPHPLPGAPRFLRLASYLLPVALARQDLPAWFRVNVLYDREDHLERVVLSLGDTGRAAPSVAVAVLDDSILARFGEQEDGGWAGIAARMLRHGAGHTAVLPARLDAGSPVPDPAALDLLAYYAAGRPVRVLAGPGAAALCRGLAARGLRVLPGG